MKIRKAKMAPHSESNPRAAVIRRQEDPSELRPHAIQKKLQADLDAWLRQRRTTR